jgi:hypothetical protein
MRQRLFATLWIGLITLCALSGRGASSASPTSTNLLIRQFQPDKPISRALRPSPISAVILNRETNEVVVTVSLVLPAGVRLLQGPVRQELSLQPGAEEPLKWEMEADEAGSASLGLEVRSGGELAARGSLVVPFLHAMLQRRLDYIPEPVPAPTQVLIGAHHCPLWEPDQPDLWQNVLKHPERTPALGFYSQNQPEVADWETKWATEHGISFFVYCWYRTSQGGAVKTKFSSAIHDALFRSKFVDRMRFTIMWENQARGIAGVADKRDLLTNLLPYWITNYFQHRSYLKVDNRPVLFIYRPEFLIQDLGSVTNVARAFQQMREACRRAGFEGLYLLGEYRGTDPKHLMLLKSLGLDYTFAYCWHVPDNPAPERAIATQMSYIRKTGELKILPQVVTVSQAWSGWRDEGSIWKIPPAQFEELLRQAGQFIATLPPEQLGHRMLLLDNWNEWGEGHYIAPYREYGFGYLDAVRNVFSTAPRTHEDLIPEDIGLGPYDREIRTHLARQGELRRLATRHVVLPAIPEGALAWWTFDEEQENEVAWDYSGHRLGGALERARRVPGFSGKALLCDGGAALWLPIRKHSRIFPC